MESLIRWLKVQWDRATAVLLTLLGLLAIGLGWEGMSGSGYPAAQLPYIVSGGILGLFLFGAAGTLWLSADLRDEWRKLDSIEGELKEVNETLHEAAASSRRRVAAARVEAKAGANGSTSKRRVAKTGD